MGDRRRPMILRLFVLGLHLCFSLSILQGCGGEAESVPEIKKSKKDLLGTEDGKIDPVTKAKVKNTR
jgi:hypothetical protein